MESVAANEREAAYVAELVADVQLVGVEEQQDARGAVREPVDDLGVIVAAVQPLLFA
jgi:hypothetical protein